MQFNGVIRRINRNIVECKDRYGSAAFKYGSSVLIETLWNVKAKEPIKMTALNMY